MEANKKSFREEALAYHAEGRPGKIEVIPTKPYSTQKDLSLAYSPGVAEPCLEIQKNPDDAYKYTDKGNLVAVISNGTAVLGLGNIGAQAGKPVMEGKGLLFKTFADIDVFDIEVDTKDTEQFIETVKYQSPGMFRHRGASARRTVDPGHARRPARYCHHFSCSPAQRARNLRKEDRSGTGGGKRGRCRSRLLRKTVYCSGSRSQEYGNVRQ